MIKTGTLENLIIESSSSILEAMDLIDKNGLGICFVVKSRKLEGILTDGDIRRLLLAKKTTDEIILNVMQKKCISLKVGSDIKTIQEHLVKTDYIPIIDEENNIVDFASRARFHQIPLTQPILNGNELEYVTDCINTGWISSQGKYVNLFEEIFVEYTGGNSACAVSNGTVALHLALIALGIKPGDEVIVPNLTFAAPVNAIIYSGATPVLIDVNKNTMSMDVDELQNAITEKTTAIIPVHLYGHPAPMKEIMEVAKLNNLIVIEDCAEALGSFYDDKHVGTYGDAGTFSFFGNKTITTGEGGMIIFKDKLVFEHAKVLRDHGMSKDKKYWHEYIGFNYRMTNMQAAIGVAQMEVASDFIKAKQRIADEYDRNLDHIEGIQLPQSIGNVINSYWLYTLVLPKDLSPLRDKILELMLKEGVEARPIFFPMSEMPPYQKYIDKNTNYEVSKYLSKSAISLPSGVNMNEHDIQRAANSFINAIEKAQVAS
jgi:perosamine synthetase